MADNRETVIQRVINFLYDTLDRFRDTMSEMNQNVSTLMDSLKKAEGDLTGTGFQRTGTDRSAVLSTISQRGPQASSSSREKLIALLSGQQMTAPRAAIPAGAPSAGPPRPPVAGPPKAGPPRPPAAGPPRPPAVGPPQVAPPAAGPPRPPAVGPPQVAPPAAVAPRLPVAGPPRPAAATPAAGTGAPTISGLRDEMLKELKRLKSIMKGEK